MLQKRQEKRPRVFNTAEYLDGEIKVDKDEIVDAKWFSKEEIPGIYRESISISCDLIEWFLNR